MEEVVALLAGNLEANKTEVLSRDNGLLAFATDNDRFEFHSSPLQLSWLSLVGKAGFAMSLDLCWLLRARWPPVSRAREAHQHRCDSACATNGRLGMACLVLRAEEEVVGRIGNENLVTHIAGD